MIFFNMGVGGLLAVGKMFINYGGIRGIRYYSRGWN